MRFRIRFGHAVVAWRPVHHPGLCDGLTGWLVDRAAAAEHALETERAAHAHLARCRDLNCSIYQLLNDDAVTAATELIDLEMETTDV